MTERQRSMWLIPALDGQQLIVSLCLSYTMGLCQPWIIATSELQGKGLKLSVDALPGLLHLNPSVSIQSIYLKTHEGED